MRGSLRRDVSLKEASGAPAGLSLSHLAFRHRPERMALWVGEQQLDVRRSALELGLVDKQEVRVEAATLCEKGCSLCDRGCSPR